MKHTHTSQAVFHLFCCCLLIEETKADPILTGNEGGKMMCLGELLNVPTAMTAFTGMVNIWEKKGGCWFHIC